MRNIWDTVTGNYRFIKYDGSEYRRKGIASFLDRPEIKVGLACLAFNIAAVGYLNGDLTSILTGQFSDISKLTTDKIIRHSYDFLYGAGMSYIFCRYVVNNRFPRKNKAIDTHGTTLSRSQLSLKDIEGLKYARSCGILFGALEFCMLAMILFDQDARLSTDRAMLLTTCFLAFERSQKILNGKYVICDEPPKKTATSTDRSGILNGVKSPS